MCPSPPVHQDGTEREVQFVDMENFAESEFTPLAVWLDSLRTRHPDDRRLPALIEFLEVFLFFICVDKSDMKVVPNEEIACATSTAANTCARATSADTACCGFFTCKEALSGRLTSAPRLYKRQSCKYYLPLCSPAAMSNSRKSTRCRGAMPENSKSLYQRELQPLSPVLIAPTNVHLKVLMAW